MDLLERYYDTHTFILYSLFAVVPGKKLWPRKIFVPFTILVLSFVAVFQALKFVVDGCTLANIVDILPSFATIVGCVTYILYVIFATEEDYKELLMIIWSDLQQKRSKEESAIKERHASSAKRFTKYSIAFFLLTASGICLSGLIPCVLNLISSGNRTYDRQLIFDGEIFIDQTKYFYHLYFVESCATFSAGILIFASENMCVIVLQHLCGMFEVVGYRLKNITREQEFEVLNKADYVHLVSSRLHICIEYHQRTLRLAMASADFYDIPGAIILVGTFCTLSISLVQVADPELIKIKMVLYLVSQFVQFFLLSYVGQREINASVQVSQYAYNTEWHICPAGVRRMLQMTILRSNRPCELVARRLYTFSIENFMSVLQAVMSFYMVLRNCQ